MPGRGRARRRVELLELELLPQLLLAACRFLPCTHLALKLSLRTLAPRVNLLEIGT